MNGHWNEETVNRRIDEIQSAIAADMVKDCQRWGKQSYAQWQAQVADLRDAAAQRKVFLTRYVQGYFHLSDAQMRAYGFDMP